MVWGVLRQVLRLMSHQVTSPLTLFILNQALVSKYGGVKGRGEAMEGEEPHNLVERTLSHLWASRRGLLEMELFQVQTAPPPRTTVGA